MTNTADFESVLKQIHDQVITHDPGRAADYIPELAHIDPKQFGMYLHQNNGAGAGVGNWDVNFSIQSVIKVLNLSLAYRHLDGELWERVGVEPSGTAFNSLGHLEHEYGVPRNPFSNAGALVVCDVLMQLYEDPRATILETIRSFTNNPDIDINGQVADSEKSTGHRNLALAHMIKSLGNISHPVEPLLDLYFDCCSITLNCQDLTKLFSYLANQGQCCQTQTQLLTKSQAKRINAIMLSCGFYDEAGEFAYKVGLPGKSGVSGAIIAVLPNQFTLATWSPGLNAKGNSLLGQMALEKFTTLTGQSIF